MANFTSKNACNLTDFVDDDEQKTLLHEEYIIVSKDLTRIMLIIRHLTSVIKKNCEKYT